MIKLRTSLKVFVSCYLILLQLSVILAKGQTRIVGGYATTINDAPYLVQLLKNGKFGCGGSVIAPNFVLTAAHCVYKVNPQQLTVVGGVSKLSDIGVKSAVSKIIIPTDYNHRTMHMDVAVLKLQTPITAPSIIPIAMYEGVLIPGEHVYLYGWGKLSEAAKNATMELQTTRVKIISTYECAKMYLHRMSLTSTMFCAGAEGQDACSGDSGGPAIVKGKLAGIVSWGLGCARSDSPGVYSNVAKLSGFIHDAMNQ